MRLHFDPWEAYYVVMRRADEPPTAEIDRTNLHNPILLKAPTATGGMSGPRARVWYRFIPPPGARGVELAPSGKQRTVLWNG